MSTVSKFKLLVVDDEKDIGDLIIDMLSADYEGIHANSGEQALEILAKHGSEIVAVVSDYKMSGMTGMDLRMAMLEKWKDIPFILVSGFISREARLRVLKRKSPRLSQSLLITIKWLLR